jgi:fimbrial chaperone protein
MKRISIRPAKLPAFFFIILAVFPISPAYPGTFKVAPVGAVFPAGKKMASLTVTNAGETSALIQVELFDWEQKEGKDVLTPTTDLLASPPVFTVPGGKNQVLRIALKKRTDAIMEKTYRIFLTEVPVKEGNESRVNVAMRLSLPVFVEPDVPVRDFAWKIRNENGEKALLTLENRGNIHAQVGTVHIFNCGRKDEQLYEAKLGEYIFGGRTKSWDVALKPAASPDCPLVLVVETAAGAQEIPLQKENFPSR